MKPILITLASAFVAALTAAAQPGDLLAPTPPMGWNSWNWFGKKEIDERIVCESMDAMVNEGLRDAGYRYVVVDGGWRANHLGANGELLADPVKFPHGMKYLADYAHARGLKFGVHTVPGTLDCGGDPVGGFGHEPVQVKQFVDWGLDFVKLDKCRYSSGWSPEVLRSTYAKWNDLLAHCGRPMVLSMSAYKYYDWYPRYGQMGRTTPDILARVSGSVGAVFDSKPRSVMALAEENNESAQYAGKGYWNDPDMLVTGDQGLSAAEQQSHFALWCVMSAPLMLGNDPRAMSTAEKDLVLNREAIAVNQDPTEQGRRVQRNGQSEIWSKHLQDGRVAVVLLNRATTNAPVTLAWSAVGLLEKVRVRDVFEQADLGLQAKQTTRTLPAHGCAFLILTGASSAAAKAESGHH
ncbi:MAG: glycoside hydrolase family 27 protein [Verrucomicrobiota bacterium]